MTWDDDACEAMDDEDCWCDDARVCSACREREVRGSCTCAKCAAERVRTRERLRPPFGGMKPWALSALGLDVELEMESEWTPIAWARACAGGHVEIACLRSGLWRVTARSPALERVSEYPSREGAMIAARQYVHELEAA